MTQNQDGGKENAANLVNNLNSCWLDPPCKSAKKWTFATPKIVCKPNTKSKSSSMTWSQ